jgi:hypothetical protein
VSGRNSDDELEAWWRELDEERTNPGGAAAGSSTGTAGGAAEASPRVDARISPTAETEGAELGEGTGDGATASGPPKA